MESHPSPSLITTKVQHQCVHPRTASPTTTREGRAIPDTTSDDRQYIITNQHGSTNKNISTKSGAVKTRTPVSSEQDTQQLELVVQVTAADTMYSKQTSTTNMPKLNNNNKTQNIDNKNDIGTRNREMCRRRQTRGRWRARRRMPAMAGMCGRRSKKGEHAAVRAARRKNVEANQRWR